MKAFAILGFALICLSQQVSGEKGDLLQSLFNEKAKQLKSEKLPESKIFLAVDPSPAPAPAVVCNANLVVVNATTLMKNTLDIISETFNVVYTARYPSSGSQSCSFSGEFGKFRCFIWEFANVKVSVQDVAAKVLSYKSNAADLLSGIKAYIKNCPIKTT